MTIDARRAGVTRQMADRLLANRHGKLTSEQWKDMVTEPLSTLLLLLAPTILILGPRLVLFSARWLLIGLVIATVALLLPLIFRARRYARAPLYFETLYASDNPRPFWMFWRPQMLLNEAGEPIAFARRLAPFVGLQPLKPYIVYYLREPNHNVLLSIAPADHPNAGKWQPSSNFYARQARRQR